MSGSGSSHLEGSSQHVVDASGRRRVTVYEKVLEPGHPISTAITSNFKKFFHPTGYTWKMVSPEIRRAYVEEFQKEFYWDPSDTEIILKKFQTKCAERYKDMVYSLHKHRRKGCPDWMAPEVWPGFCAYWDSEEFKSKSEKASKNRLTEADGPGTGIAKHRGGSRSAVAHAAALAKEKGVTPNDVVWETFQRLDSNPSGYTDEKSARIAAEVLARAQELSQPLLGTEEERQIDMSTVFLEHPGVAKKNRIFGLGNRSSVISCPSVSSPVPPHYDSNAAISELEKKMAAQQELFQEQMRQQAAELEHRQQERLQQQAAEFERRHQEMLQQQTAMYEEMRRQFRSRQHSPPSSP